MNRMTYIGLVAVLLLAGAAAWAGPAAPAAAHPWWALDRPQATQYYEQGRQARRDGRSVEALRLSLGPAQEDAVTRLDAPGTYLGVSLAVPALQLRRDGFDAENRMASPAECQAEVSKFLGRPRTVDFVGVIRPVEGEEGPSLALTPLVVVETSSGTRLRLDEPASASEMTLSTMEGKAAFAMAHRDSDDTHLLLVSIPLYDKAGKPFLAPDTKWVRVWIFGRSKRIAITYDLQGGLPGIGADTSTRVTVGKAE